MGLYMSRISTPRTGGQSPRAHDQFAEQAETTRHDLVYEPRATRHEVEVG